MGEFLKFLFFFLSLKLSFFIFIGGQPKEARKRGGKKEGKKEKGRKFPLDGKGKVKLGFPFSCMF